MVCSRKEGGVVVGVVERSKMRFCNLHRLGRMMAPWTEGGVLCIDLSPAPARRGEPSAKLLCGSP